MYMMSLEYFVIRAGKEATQAQESSRTPTGQIGDNVLVSKLAKEAFEACTAALGHQESFIALCVRRAKFQSRLVGGKGGGKDQGDIAKAEKKGKRTHRRTPRNRTGAGRASHLSKGDFLLPWAPIGHAGTRWSCGWQVTPLPHSTHLST